MLLPLKPRHPSFLPLVECTELWLHNPFGKLLRVEFCLLQVDSGLSFGPTEVCRIIALIICIEFIITTHCSWGKICNAGNIYPAGFRSRLEWFCWQVNYVLPQYARTFSVFRWGGDVGRVTAMFPGWA
jgi:hypothetical protein